MENNNYNSLTEQLIQNGILSSSKEQKQKDFIESYYGIKLSDGDMSNSPFVAQPIQEQQEEKKEEHKKRLNQLDYDLIKNGDDEAKAISTLNRFLNLKKNSIQKGSILSLEFLFCRFFPRLYRAKLIKEAMLKLNELNIDAKTLLDKTIPYGESEGRYKDLIKYLNYANEIQTRLKKRI